MSDVNSLSEIRRLGTSHPLAMISDNDFKMASKLLDVGLDQDSMNLLLEYHLVNNDNIKISELLLEKGANTNHICKGEVAGAGSLYEIGRRNGDKNFLLNEPIPMQMIYVAVIHYGLLDREDRSKGWCNPNFSALPEKMQLLTKFDMNVEIQDKRGDSLISLLSKLTKEFPCFKSYNQYEITNKIIDPITKATATLIEAGATISKKEYESNKKLFHGVVTEIGGRIFSRKLEKGNFGYNTFNKLITMSQIEPIVRE